MELNKTQQPDVEIVEVELSDEDLDMVGGGLLGVDGTHN